jgi:hypothetical protein
MKLIRVALLLLVLTITSHRISKAQEQTWNPAANVSQDAYQSQYPSLVADPNGVIHLVWLSVDEETGETAILHARKEQDLWWAPIDIVVMTQYTPHDPVLAGTPDGWLHLVWRDGSYLYHTYALAAKAEYVLNWSPPLAITDPDAALSTPDLQSDQAGGLHLVFTIQVGAQAGVYYMHQPDGQTE